MRNYDEFSNYRVLGAAIQPTIMTGFGTFSLLASQVLLDEKLGKDDGNGVAKFDPNEWCPLQNWLRAFDRINSEFGEYILKQMGNSVPQNIPFPPSIADVESALTSIDIAYHMNHSRDGVPMFSPESGKMQEGIGHYVCKRTPNKQEMTCVVDSLYPCAFDEGLLQAMAQRFSPSATLKHTGNCRKRGGASCTYVITWK